MKVIDNDWVVMCDVDDTLVKWGDKHNQPHENAVRFLDETDNSVCYLIPHKRHIDLLKKYKARGYMVIVWSGGGYKWAKSVVETLKLDDVVDFVLSKPIKVIDDLPITEWMPKPLYLTDFE